MSPGTWAWTALPALIASLNEWFVVLARHSRGDTEFHVLLGDVIVREHWGIPNGTSKISSCFCISQST
jgi:hypothetical protein